MGRHQCSWIRRFNIIKMVCVVCTQLYLTPCDPMAVAHQTPLSMGFSRQEYWSGLPFPSLGNLSDPRIKSASPASPALPGR